MKKKHILILIILIAPVMAISQFRIEPTFSIGINKIKTENISRPYEELGVSYKGGLDVIYHSASKLNFLSGIYFSHHKSQGWDTYVFRSSKTISIPLNINWQIIPNIIDLQLGPVVHFNLNKVYHTWANNKQEHLPIYASLQVGGVYSLSKQIKIGLIADFGLTPYLVDIYLWPSQITPPESILDRYYFNSFSIKLNYALFRK